MPDQHERELQVIDSVADAPPLKKFLAYARISGPGWLQGAITLGGGSLAGALFLGVISGYGLLWVQPLAMICGVIMLSAIAYVTLSTGARPFHAINRHLNPLLGWSWLVATIMANIVWTMPQFSLATAAIQQNLLGGWKFHPTFICLPLLALGLFVNWLYEAGGKGAKMFDLIIKIMVAIIVLSFFAVVGALLFGGKLPIGEVLKGFFPNPSLLFNPAAAYEPLIAQSNFPDFWREKIVSDQQDVIITAFGTAVGINMTFLLPYSLLKKRWGKKHRGLSITDLSIGLFVPFLLATSCVVIASASSFHGKSEPLTEVQFEERRAAVLADVSKTTIVDVWQPSSDSADIKLHQMLTKRDTDALATTLEPFAGEFISQKIFGIGVLGMAVSTIIILMLMNGLAFQEAFSRRGGLHPPSQTLEAGPRGSNPPPQTNDNKALFFLGCLISGLAGCCFPFIWKGPNSGLAIPTSVIGGSLIPIAYFTFLLMMNSKKILGDARPKGRARIIWNTLMIFATSVATLGSIWVLLEKTKATGSFFGLLDIQQAAWGGLIFLAVLFVVGLVSFLRNEKMAR